MDTLTHAISGALAYKGLCSALPPAAVPKSAWAVPLVMLAAAAPDADIFFAATPVEFLLLHRGITHSLAALPVMACLLALGLFPLWWRSRGAPCAAGLWSFRATAAFAAGLTLLHIWLDCVTTYGTMIFLPFSDYRVRLNGLFIVDLWLLIPMLAGLLWGSPSLACRAERAGGGRPRKKWRHALLLCACAWIVLYPATAVIWRMQIEGQELIRLVDQNPAGLTVLPDALAPRHWRVLYATQGLPPDPARDFQPPLPDALSANPLSAKPPSVKTEQKLHETLASRNRSPYNSVHQQALNALAEPSTEVYAYPAASLPLVQWLTKEDASCGVFFRFTLLPLQYAQPWEEDGTVGTEYAFYDLRFASLVPFVEKMLSWRRGGQVPFLLRVRVDSQGKLRAVRMILSGGNRDSGWQAPRAPQAPTIAQWLVGLHSSVAYTGK